VLGLLVLLLFCILDAGMLMNTQLVLSHAAREGARRAAVEGGATAAVYERIGALLEMGGIHPEDVEIYISPFTASYGWTIRVRLTCTYQAKTPLFAAAVRGSVPLTAEVITRSERVR
jgi:hypothetical protein